MELPFNQYRLSLFQKQMSKEDYDYLFNQKSIIQGLINIERVGNYVKLTAKIKRTEYESFMSPVGYELAINLKDMYDDLYSKLKEAISK